MECISVPSRFACLKIEDEEVQSLSNKSTTTKKKVESKQNKKSKTAPKQIQSSCSNSNRSKKSKSKIKQDDKQWEEWKKKDDEVANDNFEQDLQCAILQSKLDYETQKKNSGSVILTTQNKSSKKKKTKTMSLNQFLEDGKPNNSKVSDGENNRLVEKNFFGKAVKSAKQEIKKERVEEKRRERSNNIEEVITLAQCQEKLEAERLLNKQLRLELQVAKEEITVVKKRNKTLCNMLSQGEMKDKAAVLLELEKLTTVKEELTEEVTKLHKLLEQERSSKTTVNISSENQHKEKKKKKKN